jgi:hypothetical protein
VSNGNPLRDEAAMLICNEFIRLTVGRDGFFPGPEPLRFLQKVISPTSGWSN